MTTRWILIAVCLLIWPWPDARAAEEPLLAVSVAPVAIKSRTGAIQHVTVYLDWRGRDLLRGRLQLRMGDGFKTRTVYRSSEIALVAGEQALRLALPSTDTQYGGTQTNIEVSFLTESGRRLPLGGTNLLGPAAHERNLVIAAVMPMGSNRYDELIRSLQLERYRPTDQGEALSTTTVRLSADAMPAGSLGYTAFDLVTLPAEVLPDVSPGGMEDIGAWVRGGGSLVLVLEGPVPAEHADAINRWSYEAGSAWRLTLDEQGRPSPETPSVTLLGVGLGRAVILSSSSVAANDRAWREAIAHLWRLRPAQRQSLVQHGRWRGDVEERAKNEHGYYGPYGPYYSPYTSQQDEGEDAKIVAMQAMPTIGSHELMGGLMPSHVRLIPFGLVLLILVGFTVAIGPGDYLLLGLIRRRRWTWVVFPVTAVAFTAVTIALSEGVMGRTDVRHGLVITDIGKDGRVLRENRFDLLFPGSSRGVRDSAEDALLTAVDLDRFGASHYYDPYDNSRRVSPPIYDGRVPGRYELHQQVEQWTPRLTRALRLPAEPVQEGTLQWDRVTAADMAGADSYRGRQELIEKLGVPEAFDGTIFLIRGKERYTLRGQPNPLSPRLRGGEGGEYGYGYIPFNESFGADSFLSELCARQPEGFFSIVSAISPSGGDSLEDLAVMDEADEKQSLIAAVWRRGDDVHMVRRVYHEE